MYLFISLCFYCDKLPKKSSTRLMQFHGRIGCKFPLRTRFYWKIPTPWNKTLLTVSVVHSELPRQSFMPFLSVLLMVTKDKSLAPPLLLPYSGSCREQWGNLSASTSQEWATQCSQPLLKNLPSRPFASTVASKLNVPFRILGTSHCIEGEDTPALSSGRVTSFG